MTDVTHHHYYGNCLLQMCRYRDGYLNRVLAPVGEVLSFASPKESTQSLGGPDAACFLRSGIFIGGCP
jgi:hypothetical protein